MRRIHVRIFLALITTAVLAAMATHGLWLWLRPGVSPNAERVAELADIVDDALPDHLERAQVRRRLRLYARRVGMDLTLYDREGHVVAGPPHPTQAPSPGATSTRGRAGYAVPLADGRVLLATEARRGRPPPPFLLFVVSAIIFLVGSYLLARGMTRRLEALQDAVEGWGRSPSLVRVPVSGRDEVARLAEAFNGAAARIEALVAGQGRMLASASHELRTPITRIRVAMELLEGTTDPSKRAELTASVETDLLELDGLVQEILTSARLEGTDDRQFEAIDLGGLVMDEIDRFDDKGVDLVVGEGALVVQGDERLLRRLVRNLVENAFRYGDGGPPKVRVGGSDEQVELAVIDRGPGVSDRDRERIFEPFFRAAHHHEGQEGGVGLGLYLVRQIARRHGGDIEYERRDGSSEFRVRIPRRGPAMG
ncbi:MAG: HAMP domain-containing histidine kinase [Myxococcales bacterium]|nr:HAMP domain-containing histidine kinase [Myxococcales bacterium]